MQPVFSVVAQSALLASSFVVHVASAALWTGAVLYAAYAVLPAARAGGLDTDAFAATVDGVLQVTRWTGVTLPVTGAYQLWVLYPLDAGRLLATTSGRLVVAMAVLWGAMNGVVELGVYRIRTRGRELGLGRHFVRPLDAAELDADVPALAGDIRPYVLAAAGLAVLLLVDAALLAGGVPW